MTVPPADLKNGYLPYCGTRFIVKTVIKEPQYSGCSFLPRKPVEKHKLQEISREVYIKDKDCEYRKSMNSGRTAVVPWPGLICGVPNHSGNSLLLFLLSLCRRIVGRKSKQVNFSR
jgi:hypothetical protein